MVYRCLRRELNIVEHNLTVAPAVIGAMAAAGIFTLVLPLALGIFFWKRAQGRWRFFFLGGAVFVLFAMVLDQMGHTLLHYGA